MGQDRRGKCKQANNHTSKHNHNHTSKQQARQRQSMPCVGAECMSVEQSCGEGTGSCSRRHLLRKCAGTGRMLCVRCALCGRVWGSCAPTHRREWTPGQEARCLGARVDARCRICPRPRTCPRMSVPVFVLLSCCPFVQACPCRGCLFPCSVCVSPPCSVFRVRALRYLSVPRFCGLPA